MRRFWQERSYQMAKPDLGEKDVLNPEETIQYWNFSRRKFYVFLEKTDSKDFIAYYKKESLSSVQLSSSIY